MSLFLFLTVVQALVAAALVGLVLIQRSEGGGLGIGGGGGSPGGLMSARGAADFLTRTTKWLAVIFVVMAIVMAAIAVKATSGTEVDDSLQRTTVPVAGAQPVMRARIAEHVEAGTDDERRSFGLNVTTLLARERKMHEALPAADPLRQRLGPIAVDLDAAAELL